uniref:F-box associated domain-containing protein n=1 Tax=Oryza punctata TaxID=4537 RepID=A0A0E0LI73_ORYPU
MDLAGNVLKTIGIPVGHKVLCTHLDLVCVATRRNSCHVLNPATRAAYDLPESPAEDHMNHVHLRKRKPYTSFAFGRIASTGEYKVPGCSTVLDLQTLSSLSSVRSLQSRVAQAKAMHVGEESRAEYFSIWHQLRLAELKGYLVLLYHQRFCSTLDLWFLTDYETRAWVKEYSIQTESSIPILE